MARIAKRLALLVNNDTDLNDVYPAPDGINTSAAVLGFTNTTTASIVISIYQKVGSTSFLKRVLTLPAGIGKERFYYGFQRSVLNSTDILQIQADVASAFNVSFYGSEVEV